MKELRSILAEKGQITIPKPVRDRLGLKPGTVLSFSVEEGRIVITKEVTVDPIERVRGCLPYQGPVDERISELRDSQ